LATRSFDVVQELPARGDVLHGPCPSVRTTASVRARPGPRKCSRKSLRVFDGLNMLPDVSRTLAGLSRLAGIFPANE
jgi:hypothetical protein